MTTHGAQTALYLRMSRDRTGDEAGVDRQRDDAAKLAAELGWQVYDEYIDNDISAYSGKARPAYERMLADIEGGAVSSIIAWHPDRLVRRVADLERLITVCERHDVKIRTCRAGEMDLSTPTGRMTARIIGSIANGEVEVKSDRQKAQAVQAASAGKAWLGGRRAFGHTGERVTGADGQTRVPVVEDEAEAIREAARRVLAGESIRSVARDLTGRGVRTVGGKELTPVALRAILVSARISGRREYNPRPKTGKRPPIGEIAAETSEWDPIITTAESDRLRTTLTAASRNTRPAVGRTYLLSGILRCGRCGNRLVGRTKGDRGRYVCAVQPGGDGNRGCNGTTVSAEFADETIRDAVLVRLESDEYRAKLNASADVSPTLNQAITDDELQLAELADVYAERKISMSEWLAAREPIEARLTASRDRLARATDTAALDGMTGTYPELEAKWNERSVAERRSIVAAVLAQVDVMPSTRKLDTERFKRVWRA